MRQDILNDYQVLSSRDITEEEYNTIISLLDKYKMNKDNFIKNSKSLVLKETTYPKQIYNGYYPKDNIVVYNKKSNIKINITLNYSIFNYYLHISSCI